MHNSQVQLLKTGFITTVKLDKEAACESVKILEEEEQAIMLLDNAPLHPNTSKLCSKIAKFGVVPSKPLQLPSSNLWTKGLYMPPYLLF